MDVTGGPGNMTRAGLSILSVLALSQLEGCLMAGSAPSGSDMRLLYAAVVAVALLIILWIVIRFMR